jgi:hypothetical protein
MKEVTRDEDVVLVEVDLFLKKGEAPISHISLSIHVEGETWKLDDVLFEEECSMRDSLKKVQRLK